MLCAVMSGTRDKKLAMLVLEKNGEGRIVNTQRYVVASIARLVASSCVQETEGRVEIGIACTTRCCPGPTVYIPQHPILLGHPVNLDIPAHSQYHARLA